MRAANRRERHFRAVATGIAARFYCNATKYSAPALMPPTMATISWDIARQARAVFLKFNEFHKPPRHPKWSEASLNIKVPGWQRFKAADEWLAEHAHATTSAVDFGCVRPLLEPKWRCHQQPEPSGFIVVARNIGQLVRRFGPRCRDVEPFIRLNIVLNNANPLGIGQSKSYLSTDISLLGKPDLATFSISS